jgi:hypothetical protein
MITTKRADRRALRCRWCCLSLILILLPTLVGIARADGGVVICQRTSGPLTITVFSTEMPLRPGPADLSVLLEQADEHSPILDGEVFFELTHETGMSIRAEATRSQARNKLLYCSLIDLPLAGHWKMTVHARHGHDSAEVLQDLSVAASQPVFLSYWKLFALPVVIGLLFITNQWLHGRKKRVPARSALKNSLLRATDSRPGST